MSFEPERLIAIELFGLDPGTSNGALTKYTNDKIESWNLSKFKSMHDYCDFWRYQLEICKNPLVAIEKQNLFTKDFPDGNMTDEQRNQLIGRTRRMEKLREHYVELRSSLKSTGMPFIETPAREWQNDLRIFIKNEDYAIRKRRYKDIADEHFPFEKITQINADSYLLVEWLRNMIKYSPLETNQRIIVIKPGKNQINWKK